MAKIICSKLCVAAAAAGAVAVILSGCAATPNETNVGPYPTAYRELAREYLRKSLFDPYSVRDAQIATPKMGQILIEGTLRHEAGWTVCVRANSKNRMGAYTGIKDTALLIRDGRVLGSESDPTHYTVRNDCADAKYESFSELEEQPRQVGPRPR